MNISTFVRAFYYHGSGAMMVWLYNTNLTLGFLPWIDTNFSAFGQFDKNRFMSTTIDYLKASGLHQIAMLIVDGKLTGQIQHEISCNKATLLFEFKPDTKGEMQSYLTLKKNKEQITIQFPTDRYYTTENDKTVFKRIHSGLGAFAMTLEGYLRGIGADNHLNKLTDEEIEESQLEWPEWE